MSICQMAGIVLSTLHVFTYLMLTNNSMKQMFKEVKHSSYLLQTSVRMRLLSFSKGQITLT